MAGKEVRKYCVQRVLEHLTTLEDVGINSSMKGELLLNERHQLDVEAFVELRVWRVPLPVPGSRHDFKYALAYVVSGTCVLRYDNESGKGDHRHIGAEETDYRFTTPAGLLADFWNDVNKWRPE